jgi:hypothetical protein
MAYEQRLHKYGRILYEQHKHIDTQHFVLRGPGAKSEIPRLPRQTFRSFTTSLLQDKARSSLVGVSQVPDAFVTSDPVVAPRIVVTISRALGVVSVVAGNRTSLQDRVVAPRLP